MKAAVMPHPGKIIFEQRNIPVPGPDEILVKISHVGICGSDLHYYEHGRIGDFIVTNPIVLGHESAGYVVETGNMVKNLKAGDKVALEPGIPCGKCDYCKKGLYNLCPDVVFMATPPYDGAFVEYVAYPAHMAFKLPENVGTVEGALIEPLAVGFHAANQSEAKAGQSAMIMGSGCIGLVTMLALKAMGVTEIYVSDLIGKRLEKAAQLGATGVFKADEADVKEKILEITDGKGVDLVFETAGSSAVTQQTVELVKRGGTIVLVGMSSETKVPFNFSSLIAKEASVKTVFRYRNLYPAAIRLVEAGLIPLKEIVSHTYEFNKIPEAMETVIHNKNAVVKGIIAF